jgi:hypothetical protein
MEEGEREKAKKETKTIPLKTNNHLKSEGNWMKKVSSGESVGQPLGTILLLIIKFQA